jgi:hypothetical protein
MRHRHWVALALSTLVVAGGIAADKPKPADTPAKPEKAKSDGKPVAAPKAGGEWVGEWGPYNPANSPSLDKEKCKAIDCKVTEKEGVWHATFEGECGRPYKYTIKMEGRQAGGVVLFMGTTDLGPKGGGVYDWVGRATATEFVGFYTSAHYTGVFHMARPKPSTK